MLRRGNLACLSLIVHCILLAFSKAQGGNAWVDRPRQIPSCLAMAKRILFDANRRATRVVVEQGNQFVLSAMRQVIVSAGAIQSPQLLMVSGIGPAQVLHTYGIDLVVDLPGVGQNRWDHVFFGPSYKVNVPILRMLGNNLYDLLGQVGLWFFGGNGLLTNPSTDYIAFEKLPLGLRSAFSPFNEQELAWFPGDWPEVEGLPSTLPDRPKREISQIHMHSSLEGQYATIADVLIAPTSRGNITLRPAEMKDAPVISPNWLGTDTDRKVAIAAYKRARGIFHTLSMAPVVIGQEYFPGSEYQTDTELLDIIKNTVMTIYHAAFTCKMSVRNDTMAVLDSRAKVSGVTGLRVVDASSFPVLPPGHPQSTVFRSLVSKIVSNRPQDMLAKNIAADVISGKP